MSNSISPQASNVNTVSVPEKRLRCAFIGCGGISLNYLRIYRELPWVQVDFCVDTVLSHASEAAELVSSNQKVPARVSRDYREALTEDVDVVIINTPNHLHREHALAALAANKHILLQKPVASTFEDGLAILRAAEEKKAEGIVAGMYMSYLEQPAIQELIAMAGQGCFGSISQLHGRLMHTGGMRWSEQSAPGWRASLNQTGGGTFIQLAVHYIRLFRYISKEKIIAVNGYTTNLFSPGLEGEDTAAAVLQLESGGCATLNLSWCSTGEELSIHGTEGSAVYSDNTDLILSTQNDWRGRYVQYKGGERMSFPFPPVDMGDAWSPFNQHTLFLDAVRNQEAPPVPLLDGVEDMAVIAAFYQSARIGQWVPVGSVNANLSPEKIT